MRKARESGGEATLSSPLDGEPTRGGAGAERRERTSWGVQGAEPVLIKLSVCLSPCTETNGARMAPTRREQSDPIGPSDLVNRATCA